MKTSHTQRIESSFFFGLLLLTSLAFLWLIRSYLQPLFWAVVLAIIFDPVQTWWLGKTKGNRSFSSVLTILTIVVIVLIPMFFVVVSLSQETVNLYQKISAGRIDLTPIDLLQRYPQVEELMGHVGLDRQEAIAKLSETAVAVTRWMGERAVSIGQDAVRFIIGLFVMLYVLFFFFRDNRRIIEKLIRTLPFGDERERRLFSKFAAVSRATVKGTLVIGIIQGSLGGILFAITGLTAPIFWGAIMTVLSIIPAVGASLVWIPAAIYLFIAGDIWQAVVMVIGGSVFIGLIDNILRPILVGKDTKMPDALVLISTLGGLTIFGISGFVIGPIIAALFLVVWEMFEEGYARVIEGGE